MRAKLLFMLPALWALPLPAEGPRAQAPPMIGGSLMLAPTRLVLEGRERSSEVMVINGGDRPATFRLSVTNLEMGEDGQMTSLEGPPGDHSAQPLIRFAPRQVTLAPGASQSVRIQIRKPEHLAPGEYRCHLLFQGVPQAMAAAAEPQEGAGISVSIQAVCGLTMPLIVRHGATQARATLERLRLVAGGERPQATLEIHREGNRSTFGDLVATWTPTGGKAAPVGRINGLAVYRGLAMRRVTVELDPPRALAGGTLKVAYVEHGGTKVLAETRLTLP